jgi:hypothetical protein
MTSARPADAFKSAYRKSALSFATLKATRFVNVLTIPPGAGGPFPVFILIKCFRPNVIAASKMLSRNVLLVDLPPKGFKAIENIAIAFQMCLPFRFLL